MQKSEKVAVCFENIFLQRLFGYLRNASERLHACSAINTIQAEHSAVMAMRTYYKHIGDMRQLSIAKLPQK